MIIDYDKKRNCIILDMEKTKMIIRGNVKNNIKIHPRFKKISEQYGISLEMINAEILTEEKTILTTI